MKQADWLKLILEGLRYAAPLVAFWLGLWWQNRTIDKQARLVEQRDIRKDKRDRDSAFVLDCLTDTVRHGRRAFEQIRENKRIYYEKLSGSAGDAKIAQMVDVYLKKYPDNAAEVEEYLARLEILGMNECMRLYTRLLEIVGSSMDAAHYPKEFDFTEAQGECDDLRIKMTKLVTKRYDQLWSQE